MAKRRGQHDEPPSAEAMAGYISEIDRFARMLRDAQDDIKHRELVVSVAKETFRSANEELREAKESEHNTVSLLLKFIRPGSIDVMPLFDKMEPADDKRHGKDSNAWRSEPISVLNLSSMAARALIDADIVLVGQLQDRILAGDLAEALKIPAGMAQAIEAKLHQFIEERK